MDTTITSVTPIDPHPPLDPAPPDHPTPDAPTARPGLGWTEVAVATVSYLLLSVVGVVLLLLTVGGAVPPTVPLLAITGGATLGAVAVAVAVRVRSAAAIGLRRTSWRWLLVGVGVGVGAWLLNRVVILGYVLVTGDVSDPQAELTAAAAGSGIELVGVLLAGAVLVPFAEELLFRGIGYGALRRYGAVVATIASSVVFGLAHGINVVLFGAIVIGVLNAVLYERSRSIWPAVIAHAVNNAIIFGTVAILF